MAVVPIHAGAVLPPGIVSRVLKDAGLTPDDLRRLLK
jgi:predicted RNA binding protein YcfA (HicA-like mRNA interferase family)